MGIGATVSRNRGQTPAAACPPPLIAQGSLRNLTLDEVQHHLSEMGKPLNTMNLDELLTSVMAVEQQIHAPSSSSSSSSNVSSIQPGNYDLNCPVSRKTVDEVWREIVRHEEQGSGETFGETTLEDFLVRAGAINVGGHNCGRIDGDSPSLLSMETVVQQQEEWLQYQLSASQHQQQQNQHMTLLETGLPIFGNTIMNSGGGLNDNVPMASVALKPSLSDSKMTSERHRPDEKPIDKSIERRQKRMIKNRESAARSRARKQAYIKQLEEEVRQLTNTNKRLKKQKEEEMLLRFTSTSKARYQLRRTSSTKF